MPTLCFGGSFNPIHHGHLICARAAAEAAGYERIALIPSGQPPHKPDQRDLAPAADRLVMCKLAVSASERFTVEPVELERSGPSYTLDTILELKKRGWGEVHWLIGADMLAFLPMWYQSAEVVRQSNMVIMSRPGWQFDWMTLPEGLRHLKQNVVEVPLIEISSTQIRQRVRERRSIEFLTPGSVIKYIKNKHLY